MVNGKWVGMGMECNAAIVGIVNVSGQWLGYREIGAQNHECMVETSRLHIFPLTDQDLDLYLQGKDLFENIHQLAFTGRTVSPEVHKMVTGFTLPRMKQTTGDNFLFFTFWLVVEKNTRIVVAELGFKGEPNLRGEVEIGYGTMPGRQREGFMTEAVGGMIQWAVLRTDVRTILAETDERNIASIKVLQKNGFRQYDRKENMLWWKIATLPAPSS